MLNETREKVFNEILEELKYQDAKWGHEVDDTKNKPTDWVTYICHYAARWFDNTFPPYRPITVDDFREDMIKTAALAISAVESLDRQRKEKGKPFYQTKMP